MLRFLGNNYNDKKMLQLLTCLDEAFMTSIRNNYDDTVSHDIYSVMVYISKKRKGIVPVNQKEE